MITNSTETYGVMLTPHFEKYQTQDQETADIMQATWNFGNLLKGKGYKLAYMHGPIGLYEGVEITAGEIFFGQEDALQKFMELFPDKEQFLFFLYRKYPDALQTSSLLRADVEARRKELKIKKTKKKVVDAAPIFV